MGSVTANTTNPVVDTTEGRPVSGPAIGKGKIVTRPALVPTDIPTLGLIGRLCFTYSSRLLFPETDGISTEQDEIRWRSGRIVSRMGKGNPAFVATACDDETPVAGSKWAIAGLAQWQPPKKEAEKWETYIKGGLHGPWSWVSGQEGEYKVQDEAETEKGSFSTTIDIAKYDELMGIVHREETRILAEQGLEEGDVWCKSFFLFSLSVCLSLFFCDFCRNIPCVLTSN